MPLSASRQDPSGYEKCVSMCQKSMENLVSLLEEEEAAEARRRPKVINTILCYVCISTISTISISTYIFNSLLYQVVKLPDPTIFTITSPSQETSYFYKLKNLFPINSKNYGRISVFVLTVFLNQNCL